MRYAFLLVLMLAFVLPLSAEEDPPKILGSCTAADLRVEPYDEWFQSRYDEYVPHAGTMAAISNADRSGITVDVFFGTWCGDSRREVPRLWKLLDAVGIGDDSRNLIAVDNTDEATKRSPDGEEAGLEIYRVPTVIVRRGGEEIARIVEHPVLSLERDLLAILSGDDYEPNYASYPAVREWLGSGLLSDPNVSASGLANHIRADVVSEGELAAAAWVMLSRGQGDEAVQLFRVNTRLFRTSPSAYRRLAQALHQTGQGDEARGAIERALKLAPDADETETLLELLAELDDA